MHILPYCSKPAEFRAYDAEATEIARLLWSAVQSVEPQLQVEHVGSTSVPNCGGKGIVDLAILYPEGLLARARAVLDGFGFQQQGGPEPNEPGALTAERSARRSRTEPRYIPKVFTVSTWAIFHWRSIFLSCSFSSCTIGSLPPLR